MKKVVKILLFSLMLFLVFTLPAYAEENIFEVSFFTLFDLGRLEINLPERTLPDNWQDRFRPHYGNLTQAVSYNSGSKYHGAGVWGIEPVVVFHRNLKIGIPLSLYARYKKRMEKATLRWWDPVTLQDTILNIENNFSVGLSVRIWRFGFRYYNHKYRAIVRDYEGFDCWGCVNTSEVISEKEISNGTFRRFDLWFRFLNISPYKNTGFNVGGFLEKGDTIQRTGVTFGMTLTFPLS